MKMMIMDRVKISCYTMRSQTMGGIGEIIIKRKVNKREEGKGNTKKWVMIQSRVA